MSKSLIEVVRQDNVQKRFADVLGKSAPAFITGVLTTVNGDPQLQKCEPMSVIKAALQAATLRLPVNKDLGQAYLVSYNNQCQLQIGWKGLIQLAQRSKRYKSITAVPVFEGEIRSFNKFTDEVLFGEKISDKLVGFFARLELLDGFTKSIFWSKEKMEAHAAKYSPSYKSDSKFGRKSSIWSNNFEAMGIKTVLRRLLSQYGPMSIDDDLLVAFNAETSSRDSDSNNLEVKTIDFDDATLSGSTDNSPITVDASLASADGSLVTIDF